MKPRSFALAALIATAILSRLVPHPWNWTAIGAMALLGGARFDRLATALMVTLGALVASDLVLGFHSLIPVIYGTFVLIVIGAWWAREKMTGWRIPAAAGLASGFFFLVTNFAVWLQGGMYPMTGTGLVACYTAALPFWGNQLLGDLILTPVFFAVWDLVDQRFFAVQKSV